MCGLDDQKPSSKGPWLQVPLLVFENRKSTLVRALIKLFFER
jgi:hypothetical protein